MTTAATSLLGLALPVTGELSGTWGDTVNNSITSLLDTAIAGTTTLSTDGDVTLSTTTLAANQARQAILLCSGARTAIRTITAPAQSKIYTIINATTGGYAVKIVGVGPTTGISIPAGQTATVAWNGSDFVDASNYTNGNKVINGNLSVTGSVTLSGGTANGVAYLNGSKVLTTGSALTFNGSDVSILPSSSASLLIKAGSASSSATLNLDSGTTSGYSNQILFLVNGVSKWAMGGKDIGSATGNLFSIYNYNTSTNAITIDTNNNFGIGTVSPAKKLDVNGDALIYGITVGRGAGAVSTNTAVGASALAANTTGAYNTAVGSNAALSATSGNGLTALGVAALYANTTGSENTALGGSSATYAALRFNTTGSYNVAVGPGSLASNTTASNNTAVGYQAGYLNTTGAENVFIGRTTGYSNTTGNYNASLGAGALANNTTASYNTAVGYQAGYANTTGDVNVFVGGYAGYSTTTGVANTMVGYRAGYTNSTGQITAFGYAALENSTTANGNTGVGVAALRQNTTGQYNTALGAQALISNTTASNNTAVGYQAGYSNTTGTHNHFEGYQAGFWNTTGGYNTAVGAQAYANQNTATGSYNTAIGQSALYNNTTASYNTAVGYQALYTNTTGTENVAIGPSALYAVTTGYENIGIGRGAGSGLTTAIRNTFVGDDAGYYITTGSSNTILGRYNGNQGGLDIRTASNYIVLSDGDGNPRAYYVYATSTNGGWRMGSNCSTDSTNTNFSISNASGADVVFEAGNNSSPAISSPMRISKYTTNSRSISAAGTVNQNGTDYAEYMTKAGDFIVAKGDVVGINAQGKLTNVFADAISFCVKSTEPGIVGGDSWFTEPRPKGANNEELSSETPEYAEWHARMEAARATVDRIAFCGQVPVNVTGATAGQYIVPVNDNGAIKGVAKNESDLTMSDYIKAVGKVIAIEADGRAKIIVKIS